MGEQMPMPSCGSAGKIDKVALFRNWICCAPPSKAIPGKPRLERFEELSDGLDTSAFPRPGARLRYK